MNVSYKLTEDNTLEVAMKAVTTKPTPVNLTNHSYFNLGNVKRYSLELIRREVLETMTGFEVDYSSRT